MTYADEVLADSPVAYYKLDETSGTTLVDSSGNGHDGVYVNSPSLNQSPLVEGSTHAVSFGTQQYTRTDAAAWMNFADCTFEAWITAPVTLGTYIIAARDTINSVGTRGWHFRLEHITGTGYQLGWENKATGDFFRTSINVIEPGITYHVAFTSESPITRLYVNGVGQEDLGGYLFTDPPNDTSDSALFIGAHTFGFRSGSGSDMYETGIGLVDEAAFYPDALHPLRITAHYAAGVSGYAREVLADAPLAYWRLDERDGTPMLDSTGNAHHGTYVNTPTLGATGLVVGSGTSVDFDAASEEYGVTVAAAWQGVAQFSAEAWITPDNVTSYNCVMGRDSGTFRAWNLYVLDGLMWMHMPSAGGETEFYGSTPIEVGETYHVAVTYDDSGGTNTRLYVNGALDGSSASTLDNTVYSGLPFYVGATEAGVGPVYFPFDGRIDEVAYYDFVLTPTRIGDHYSAGTGISSVAADATLGATSTVTTTANVTRKPTATRAVTATITSTASVYTPPSDAYGAAVVTDSPLAFWRLNDTSGTTALDSSGNGHNLTYGGSYTLGATGVAGTGTGTSVNFTGGHAEASAAAWMETGSITIEAWFNPDDASGNYAIATRDQLTTDDATRAWNLQIYDGRLRGRVWPAIGSGDVEFYLSDVGTIVAGNDYHVAMTYSSSTMTLKAYVNGVETYNVFIGIGAVNSTSGTRLRIGGADPTTYGELLKFDGRIDEVAFYDHVLTEARILAHYDAGLIDTQNATATRAVTATTSSSASSSVGASATRAVTTAITSTADYTSPNVQANVTAVTSTVTSVARVWNPDANATRAVTSTTYSAASVTAPTVPYDELVIADGATAYYPLDETSGSTLTDASGNAHHGTYPDAPIFAQPSLVIGGTYSVNIVPSSTEKHGLVANDTWMDPDYPDDSFTIEAWIQPNTVTGTGYRCIVGRDSSSTRGWNLYVRNSKLQVDTPSLGLSWAGNTTLAAGSVYHVALVFDRDAEGGSGAMTSFVNGVQDYTLGGATGAWTGWISSGGSPNTGGLDLYVGATPAGAADTNFPFDGNIDEVVYYAGTALTEEQIQTHYLTGSGAELHEADASLNVTTDASAIALFDTEIPKEADAELNLTATVTAAAGIQLSPVGTWNEELFDSGALILEYTASVEYDPPIAPPPPGHVNTMIHRVSVELTEDNTADVTRLEWGNIRVRTKHKDLTWFRGVPVGIKGWNFVDPGGDAGGSFEFPQISSSEAAALGTGDLDWFFPGAKVSIDLHKDGEVVKNLWVGRFSRWSFQGGIFSAEADGQMTGPLAWAMHQPKLVYKPSDAGYMLARECRMSNGGYHIKPMLGPRTGIILDVQGDRSMTRLGYVMDVLAKCQDNDMDTWTILRDERPSATDKDYFIQVRDFETEHVSVHLGAHGVDDNLSCDLLNTPNRWYAEGTSPGGERWTNAKYPNMGAYDVPVYPNNDNRSFGLNDTDDDTDTGSGVTVAARELYGNGELDLEDTFTRVFDDRVKMAVEATQENAGLNVTGRINPATWAVIFNDSGANASLSQAGYAALLSDPRLIPVLRTATGQVFDRNDNFDPSIPRIEQMVNFGDHCNRLRAYRWLRGERRRLAREDDWAGTINLTTDPPEMSRFEIRAGYNIRLHGFNGGLLMHIAEVSVDWESGSVSLSVDTRWRNWLELAELIERNRAAAMSIGGLSAHQLKRTSALFDDKIKRWDHEAGAGIIGRREIEGGKWNVIQVPAGEVGTVQQLFVETSPDTEFAMAIFAQRVGPRFVEDLAPDPLDIRLDEDTWLNNELIAYQGHGVRIARAVELDPTNEQAFITGLESIKRGQRRIVYAAGVGEDPYTEAMPCGYWPHRKTGKPDNDTYGTNLTGKWSDDAGFSFWTKEKPYLYVAIWPRETCDAWGRMWIQLGPAI